MAYHTVIVGAGPAGLKAAETLAKAGKKVLVLEKNKIIGDKICAGGLSPKCHEMGIPKKLIERSFKKVIFHTPSQKSELKTGKELMFTVKRKELGAFMANQARKAGAEIRTNTEVTKVGKNFVVAKGKRIKFRYLIGAGGVQSIVRKYLKLKAVKKGPVFQYITKKRFKNMEVFIDVDKFGIWYAWIFPHKNYTSIGCGGDAKYESLAKLKKKFDVWCRKRFDIKKAKFETWAIHYDYQGYEFGNKFLAGEAAGLVSALTGGGIQPAMVSGRDIARKILNKDYECEGIERYLRIKNLQEFFVKTMEVSLLFARIEYWLLLKMMKTRWGARRLVKRLE